MQVYILKEKGKIAGCVTSARKALNFMVEGQSRSVEQYPLNEVNVKNDKPDRRKK